MKCFCVVFAGQCRLSFSECCSEWTVMDAATIIEKDAQGLVVWLGEQGIPASIQQISAPLQRTQYTVVQTACTYKASVIAIARAIIIHVTPMCYL